MTEYEPVDWGDDRSSGDNRRAATSAGRHGTARNDPETSPAVPAGREWRVRTEDEDGDTVVLPIGAWVPDEDGDLVPYVVTSDRQYLAEPEGEYVILLPGEAEDAEVGEDD
jgi:hypothetical protein